MRIKCLSDVLYSLKNVHNPEHGFSFLGASLIKKITICGVLLEEIIYHSLNKNDVFDFIMKNCNILININCQAMCHQS